MSQPIFRNLKVVGTFYRSKEDKAKIATLVGQTDPVPVAFQREPENQHDAHAVAVYVKVPPHAAEGEGEWVHAGYIPATVSGMVGHFLAALASANFGASADVTIEKGGPAVSISAHIGG